MDYSSELLENLVHPGGAGGGGGWRGGAGREGPLNLDGMTFIQKENDSNTQLETLRANPLPPPPHTGAGAQGLTRAPAGFLEELTAIIATFANFCRHGR